MLLVLAGQTHLSPAYEDSTYLGEVHSDHSTNACFAGHFLLFSARALASVKTALPQTSQYDGANALNHWTEVMNPHAKLERQKLLDQAEKRRKSRHLLQVTHYRRLERCFQVAVGRAAGYHSSRICSQMAAQASFRMARITFAGGQSNKSVYCVMYGLSCFVTPSNQSNCR